MLSGVSYVFPLLPIVLNPPWITIFSRYSVVYVIHSFVTIYNHTKWSFGLHPMSFLVTDLWTKTRKSNKDSKNKKPLVQLNKPGTKMFKSFLLCIASVSWTRRNSMLQSALPSKSAPRSLCNGCDVRCMSS